MTWQVTPLMVINVPLFLLTALLFVYGIIRHTRGDRHEELAAFIVLIGSIALWQLVIIFIRGITTPTRQLLGYNIIIAVLTPLVQYSGLWFALAYTNADQRLTRSVGILGAVQVLVVSGTLAIDPVSMLEVDGVTTQGPLTLLTVTFQEWVLPDLTVKLPFRLYQLYVYLLALVTTAILVRYLLRNRTTVSTGQTAAICVAIGTPLVTSSLVFIGVVPPEQSFTDVGFGIAGVSFAVAVFRYRLLEIAPVGRQQVVETMDDPVVMVDDGGRVVDCNPAARDLVDAPTGWRGIPAGEFFAPFPDQYEQFVDKTSATAEISVATSGTTRDFDVEISPIGDGGDKVTGRLIVLKDITEQKERERKLERREQQLDLMRQVQSRVLRHNIRNDLQVIKLSNEMLAEEVATEHVPTAERAVSKAEDLISVSGKARAAETLIEQDQTPTQRDLSAVLEETVETYRTEFPDVSFALTCPDTCVVEISPSLEPALENIVENAAEHNEGATQTVEVVLRSDDQEVVITIADDGRGIDIQELRVLEEESESSLEHGSGMGLWIVHWAVDISNAEIEYATDANGTEVTFRIPR